MSWPIPEVRQAVHEGKLDSAETVFRHLRKSVLSSSPEQLAEQGAEAELVWNFLFDFAAKRKVFRAQVLECVSALMESKAWENSYSNSAALQKKAQGLPGELPAALAAHDAIMRSFTPQRVAEIRNQPLPNELQPQNLREGLAAGRRAEQLHRRLLDGSQLSQDRALQDRVLDELQDAIDGLHEQEETAFARLRRALLHAVVMPEALDRESASAPVVWTFLLDFTQRHHTVRKRLILEVVNLLADNAAWRQCYEASPMLKQRFSELPVEVQQSWAVQRPGVFAAAAEGDSTAQDVASQMASIRQSMSLRDSQPAVAEVEVPDEWREATDAQGRTYYYNRKTRVSQWEKPAAFHANPSESSGSNQSAASAVPNEVPGASGDGSPGTKWAVGEAAEVWSNSKQAWCPGKVESLGAGTVTVAFQLSDQQWAKKELPEAAEQLRRPTHSQPTQSQQQKQSQQHAQPEAYSADEQSAYACFFKDSGAPNSQKVVAFLYRSGLPRRCLKEIWQVGNPEAKQELEAREFYPCCRLVAHCQLSREKSLFDEGGKPLRQLLRQFLLTQPARMPQFQS